MYTNTNTESNNFAAEAGNARQHFLKNVSTTTMSEDCMACAASCDEHVCVYMGPSARNVGSESRMSQTMSYPTNDGVDHDHHSHHHQHFSDDESECFTDHYGGNNGYSPFGSPHTHSQRADGAASAVEVTNTSFVSFRSSDNVRVLRNIANDEYMNRNEIDDDEHGRFGELRRNFRSSRIRLCYSLNRPTWTLTDPTHFTANPLASEIVRTIMRHNTVSSSKLKRVDENMVLIDCSCCQFIRLNYRQVENLLKIAFVTKLDEHYKNATDFLEWAGKTSNVLEAAVAHGHHGCVESLIKNNFVSRNVARLCAERYGQAEIAQLLASEVDDVV